MVSKKYSTRSSRPSGLSKSRILLIGLAFVIAIVTLLELTNTTYIFHKQKTPAVIPVEQTNTPQASSSQANSQPSTPPTSKDAGSQSTSTSQSSSAPLISPYGDFVSNHQPNLDGQPNPSAVTSVCNTTPGATCYIRFTKGSTSTTLPVKTSDSKGVVYWSWDIKKAALTTGNWTITAVASLNGQTKSSQDQLVLSVSP